MHWYIQVLKNYGKFSGRARRKEYWIFLLVHCGISAALGFLEGLLGIPPVLSIVYVLGLFIPSLSVLVRRLHDTNRSAWWMLTTFIPFIGSLVLLVFSCLDGDPGLNRFGHDPKQEEPAAA